MATEDIKKFLFEHTGIAKSQWKRLSKHKAQDGSEVRVFQDRVSGKTLETIEDKNGNISVSDSVSSVPKAKTVGYYQFDEEEFSVALVTKEFWKENQCLDDSGSEAEYVPEHFFELSEGIYEHDFGSHEEACKALEDAGWVARRFLDEMED